MRTPMSCKLVGRWPIVEADIWDRQYLDLCGPATIVIRANGRRNRLRRAASRPRHRIQPSFGRIHLGRLRRNGRSLRRRIRRIARRRLDRDRIRISQRRRSRSQSQAEYFLNSLLDQSRIAAIISDKSSPQPCSVPLDTPARNRPGSHPIRSSA